MARKIIVPVAPKKKGSRTGTPVSKKQLEALQKHQFQKGKSGNPNGRPKGSGSKLVSKAYEAILNQEVPDWVKEKLEIDGKATWSDVIGIQLVKKAAGLPAEVNFTAITELREVTEGKVPDSHELSGPNKTPLQAPTFAIPVEFVDPKKETNDDDEQSEEDRS